MKVLHLLYFMIYLSKISTSSVGWRRLNDGYRIPPIGFGTYIDPQFLKEETMEQAVIWAIESGYRLINSAAAYGTEPDIGRAIANVTCRGIVKRTDLFIATKLNDTVTTREGVVPALRDSLERLQTSYIDLFIIHTPYNVFNANKFNLLDIWRGLEDAKKLGLVRSIGVSNFNSTQINEILTYCEIPPAVNEIEVSTTYASLELVAYCQSEDIMVISYAPLGILVPRIPLGNTDILPVFRDPRLTDIARKYNKTEIQINLRYLIDRDTIPIPKSTNKQHIQENIDVFDFCLTEKKLYLIKGLDQNIRVYPIEETELSAVIRDQYELINAL